VGLQPHEKTFRAQRVSLAPVHPQHVFAFPPRVPWLQLSLRIPSFATERPSVTGKAYYLTTLADWQRHAARFANSHFIVLISPQSKRASGVGTASSAPAADNPATESKVVIPSQAAYSADWGERSASPAQDDKQNPRDSARDSMSGEASANAETRILVLIEADEGVHLSLEDEPAFEPLPHPLAQKPISPSAQAALASHGVAPGATTFDAMETLARVHPLLRHRVF
jgi:hypothetical protein